MTFSPEVLKAAEFLQTEINHNPYSEVAVKLITHEGHVTRFEKTIIEKEKPTHKDGTLYGNGQ